MSETDPTPGSPWEAATEVQEPAEAKARGPSGVERRRPGRLADVSAALIPLLRSPHAPPEGAAQTPEERPIEDEEDGLAAARGIGIGLAISLAIWGLIAIGVWLLIR